MEIKHYNAIAKIIGGNLQGYPRFDALINSLSRYFESEDNSFKKDEFRSACINGHNMEESENIIHAPQKEQITPTNIENSANT